MGLTHKEIRTIAAKMPRYLRQMSARAVFRAFAQHGHWHEVECPACAGKGSFDDNVLKRCPICRGWERVVESLANWFEERRLRAERHGQPKPRRDALLAEMNRDRPLTHYRFAKEDVLERLHVQEPPSCCGLADRLCR